MQYLVVLFAPPPPISQNFTTPTVKKIAEQFMDMFLNATWRLRLLNAFVASTRRRASILGSLNTVCMEWTTAPQLASWLAQNCTATATVKIFFTTLSMALLMILLIVSQAPIGLAPGFLSRAINRQATKEEIPLESINSVEISRATEAKELHKWNDLFWNPVHSPLKHNRSWITLPSVSPLSMSSSFHADKANWKALWFLMRIQFPIMFL